MKALLGGLIVSWCLFVFLVFQNRRENPKGDFLCFNPEMPIQPLELKSTDLNVKLFSNHIEFTTEDGAVISVPKSLCYEMRNGGAK